MSRMRSCDKKPRLHNTTSCQTGWITCWTTGWMFVYTMQPVVQPVWQPVGQPVVSQGCIRALCYFSVLETFVDTLYKCKFWIEFECVHWQCTFLHYITLQNNLTYCTKPRAWQFWKQLEARAPTSAHDLLVYGLITCSRWTNEMSLRFQ